MPFTISPMTEADWPRVRAIYETGIASGNATFETEAPDWEGWDRRFNPEPRLVSRDGEDVVGWAALSPASPRSAYRGVAEVSVYVDPDRAGEGIGTALLGSLIAASEEAGLWTLQASIFRENGATLAVHLKHGFREVGYRERIARQNGVWRDTVVLERRSGVVGNPSAGV